MAMVTALIRTGVPAAAKPARKTGPATPDGQTSSSETSCNDVAVTGSQTVKRVVKSRRKFKNELTTRLVAAARAALAAPETGQLRLGQQQHQSDLHPTVQCNMYSHASQGMTSYVRAGLVSAE